MSYSSHFISRDIGLARERQCKDKISFLLNNGFWSAIPSERVAIRRGKESGRLLPHTRVRHCCADEQKYNVKGG